MSAATLAALIGCTGFDLIGPPDENAPHIGVSLDAVHETHSSYLLQAFFQPGTDAQGEPLASDLMLQVNGEPVEPTSAGRDLWRYQWQTTLIGRIDRADTIRLVVPDRKSVV